MGTKQPTRIAAYIRYSAEAQSDSFSLEAQERQIRRRAQQDGYTVVAVYSDPARSAYKAVKRPGLRQALADAQAGKYDVLYVHKVDRLSRRLERSLQIVGLLQKYGVSLKAVEQNFDLTKPDGKFLFHLLSSLGEFYSDNLSQETIKGKRERAEQGLHNGWAPFGYRSVLIEGRKRAVPHPEEGPAVKWAFEMYATGRYSDREIGEMLAEKGFRSRRGRPVNKSMVRDMLMNPFYIGRLRYRGEDQRGVHYRYVKSIPGVHEPLISEELFERCQEVRARRRQTVKTQQATRWVYMLNRVVVCARCGRNLRAQSTQTVRRYYRETSRERGLECEWSGTSVRADEIDAQIEHLVSRLALPEDWRTVLREVLETEQAEQPDPEGEKRRLRAELRRLRESYRRGLYEGEEYLFWREVEKLQEQIRVLENLPPTQVERAAAEMLTLQQAWSAATLEERSELVHMLFEQVGCDIPEKRIVWVKPNAGFEVLFRMLAAWEPDDSGRYWCPAEMLGLEGTNGT
jgi:site-specific DNA recombinase